MPISTKEAAARIGVIQRRIQQLITEQRIPGAQKIGRDWLVPDDFVVLPSAERASTHPAKKIVRTDDPAD